MPTSPVIKAQRASERFTADVLAKATTKAQTAPLPIVSGTSEHRHFEKAKLAKRLFNENNFSLVEVYTLTGIQPHSLLNSLFDALRADSITRGEDEEFTDQFKECLKLHNETRRSGTVKEWVSGARYPQAY